MNNYVKLAVLFIWPVCSYATEVVNEDNIHRILSEAILCKGSPENSVYGLVGDRSGFTAAYAAGRFGEGTSEKAIIILRKPLHIGESAANTVISEVENSNFDFAAFTYARFEGDYRKVVKLLKLQPAEPFTDQSLGRFVSQQPKNAECPPTITLTPQDDGYFLLGCGWCNGG